MIRNDSDGGERAVLGSLSISPGKRVTPGLVRLRPLTQPNLEDRASYLIEQFGPKLTPETISLLGGQIGPGIAELIQDWIREACEFCIIEVKANEGEWAPAGFLNVALRRPSAGAELIYEVGRVFVLREYEGRGIGTQAVWIKLRKAWETATDALVGDSHLESAMVVVRTLESNERFQRLARSLRLVEIQPPQAVYTSQSTDKSRHRWFRLNEVMPSRRFGRAVETARTALRMKRSTLAALCEVAPSQITMVERGTREPSAGLLRRIFDVLGTDQDTRLSLYRNFFGATELSVNREIQEADLFTRNLWVLSDAVAEIADDAALASSVEALRAGRERVFFIPDDFPEQINALVSRLKGSLSGDFLYSNLQILRAPPELCALRVAFYDPNRTTGSAATVTIAGGDGSRVEIDPERTATLVRKLGVVLATLKEGLEFPGYSLVRSPTQFGAGVRT